MHPLCTLMKTAHSCKQSQQQWLFADGMMRKSGFTSSQSFDSGPNLSQYNHYVMQCSLGSYLLGFHAHWSYLIKNFDIMLLWQLLLGFHAHWSYLIKNFDRNISFGIWHGGIVNCSGVPALRLLNGVLWGNHLLLVGFAIQ